MAVLPCAEEEVFSVMTTATDTLLLRESCKPGFVQMVFAGEKINSRFASHGKAQGER